MRAFHSKCCTFTAFSNESAPFEESRAALERLRNFSFIIGSYWHSLNCYRLYSLTERRQTSEARKLQINCQSDRGFRNCLRVSESRPRSVKRKAENPKKAICFDSYRLWESFSVLSSSNSTWHVWLLGLMEASLQSNASKLISTLVIFLNQSTC